MTVFKKVSVFIIILLIAFAYWYFNSAQIKALKSSPADDVLEAKIIDCDDITERAAANLVAVVEFQKLEIIGRKARVFKQCMQDHHYVENAEWLKYTTPVAKKVAEQTNISIDEAIENLRRANMVIAKGDHDRPAYWTSNKNATP
jgi:formate dehydrogenase maturation protein FdhE